MTIKVMYKSKKNNKKVALAIAEELGVQAESIDGARDVQADILFLGSAILGGNVAPAVERFAEGLDKDKVKTVVLFSSNGFGTDQFGPLKEKLAAKGVKVYDSVFSCKGSAFFFKNRGKPGKEELSAARQFAREAIGNI